ncbi:uncharacterized protein LOC107733749 [Sinocyclocheilus rhinocerous]|uniref:uncharacterized protein LOC107733749 n=1 Tax=Sinocyclocheilus rhinocerous TaxID=307959 RepID=UPI0007B9015B|nr:PREDICTED: uncharacterized protein LOC107733749 [Sinocyclocheilus rhinocerous]
MMKFAEPGMTINPIKLTKSLNKALGEINSAKTLRDGNLIIMCKDEKQQNKVLSINSMLGYSVSCTLMKTKPWVRGVITGIPTDVHADKIKSCVEGGEGNGAKRLQYVRNKERMDSLSVMLQFDEERMPERVKIGYVSYPVRPYVPPPLRCFKCQKYGHVSAVCRGRQRCARCGGDHVYGKCGEGAKAKCCNCGGEHSAGFGGCIAHKHAVKIQNVRITEGLTYAEAAQKAKQNEQIQREIKIQEWTGNTVAQRKTKEDSLVIGKMEFVSFMAEVVNCSAQTESRTERIKIKIRAAERYLNVAGVTLEKINDMLKTQSSTQTTYGST